MIGLWGNSGLDSLCFSSLANVKMQKIKSFLKQTLYATTQTDSPTSESKSHILWNGDCHMETVNEG